jgi:succinate-semialdehyde dehydrogenase/glutarate-semialdehyde dehydrogenase
MTVWSVNPATGERIEAFDETDDGALDRILDEAFRAYEDWRRRPVRERAAVLARAARCLRDGVAEHARTMTLEMGKPIVQAEAEVQKCAWACEYYAEHAEAFLAPVPRETDGSWSGIRFDPLGPVFAIMPWNFPYWQVVRFAAPALVAGNTAVLKHAPNVTRCALRIQELFREAGLPEGAFGVVVAAPERVPEVAARIVRDPRIRAVTLTGSDRAGSAVGAEAGRAIKKTVLELGGSDPFLVLEDADLDAAARAAAEARCLNSGQSCVAAKRFIVVESVADAFLERFVAEMRARKVGDPMARDTQVGPLARHDLRDRLHAQVEASVRRGAECLLGGRVPDGPGAYYPPTVLAAVHEGMPAFDEETFGPAAAVVRAKDEADAVRLANRSAYGLGASLWTRDRVRAERLVPEIEAGLVFVNGLVKSDPRLPFGGVKRSGYGRELSELGLREFVNVKTVWIA